MISVDVDDLRKMVGDTPAGVRVTTHNIGGPRYVFGDGWVNAQQDNSNLGVWRFYLAQEHHNGYYVAGGKLMKIPPKPQVPEGVVLEWRRIKFDDLYMAPADVGGMWYRDLEERDFEEDEDGPYRWVATGDDIDIHNGKLVKVMPAAPPSVHLVYKEPTTGDVYADRNGQWYRLLVGTLADKRWVAIPKLDGVTIDVRDGALLVTEPTVRKFRGLAGA